MAARMAGYSVQIMLMVKLPEKIIKILKKSILTGRELLRLKLKR